MAARPSDTSADRSAVSQQTPDDDNPRLGEQLRRARERHGLTLAQIAKETKIPLRHLEALEHGNLEAVPGEFYRRAEIRAFALAVNLDQTEALGWLERAAKPSVARETKAEPSRTGRATRSGTGLLTALGLSAGIVVFGLATAGRKPARRAEAQMHRVTDLLPHRFPVVRHAVLPLIPATQRARLARVSLAPFAADGPMPVAPPLANARVSTIGTSFTELVVETQPAGARVTVNRIGWGAAPITIRYLPEGDKAIRVSKDEYASEERTVRLEEGHSRRVTIRLRPVS